MDTNAKGNLGESRAITYFIKNGYEVYLPFGTGTINDMIVVKDNKSLRVSVKSTSTKIKSGKWEVRLRQKTTSGVVLFDRNKTDILIVYIIPEDRIVFIDISELENKTSISVI